MYMVNFHTEVTATLDARHIGSTIARANSSIQVDFFEGLAQGFQAFSQGDSDGCQILWLKDEISQQARDFIKKLNTYINEK